MTTYQIIETSEELEGAYQPWGAAADLWMCKKPEQFCAGPAETGKTFAALHKIDAIAWKYPKAHIAMLRKTRQSMDASVLKTYIDKIKHPDIFTYGGHKPQWFDYPNGSRIVVGGLDNPNKVLSAEYDIIYVNQAEELNLDEWEKLLTRTTGRAGHVDHPQVIGDCNPGPKTHWILQRKTLESVAFLESRHEHNPTLYDPHTGQITEQGQRTMAVLDSLSGVRYQRLRLGKWVSAEGQIYDAYDAATHLIDRFDIPLDWRRFRVIDFGLVRPFVCQWWAADEDDRLYLYREIYMAGRTVTTHAKQINELSEGEHIEQTICDHDAEDRATLAENGIPNIAAKKDVLQGIGRVQDRLSKQDDGKPRLFLLRDSLVEVDQELQAQHSPICTADEIDSYVWQNNSKREQPVKENDHGCFVAETIIKTSKGDTPIKDIRAGDFALTRSGYRKVTDCGLTNRAAKVKRCLLSDGTTLIGTGDHPVYMPSTQNYIELRALRHGEIIEVSNNYEMNSGPASIAAMNLKLINMQKRNSAPVHVVSVSDVQGRKPVYNLTVSGDPGEYFANGVLVHNCDSARYMVMHLDGGSKWRSIKFLSVGSA